MVVASCYYHCMENSIAPPLEKLSIYELKSALKNSWCIFAYHYIATQDRTRAAESAGFCRSGVESKGKHWKAFVANTISKAEWIKERDRVNGLLRTQAYKMLQNPHMRELVRRGTDEALQACLKEGVIAKLVRMIFFDPTEMLSMAEQVNGNQGEFFRLLNATDQGQFLTKCKVTTDGTINLEWVTALSAIERLSRLLGWDTSELNVKADLVDESELHAKLEGLLSGLKTGDSNES